MAPTVPSKPKTPRKPKPYVRLSERPRPSKTVQVERLVEGEFYRAAWYSESHKCCRDERTALCGRPLDLDLHAWVVVETRKTGRCAMCVNKRGELRDLTDAPSWKAYEGVTSSVARLPVLEASRKDALMFEAKVALVKRLLGATER